MRNAMRNVTAAAMSVALCALLTGGARGADPIEGPQQPSSAANPGIIDANTRPSLEVKVTFAIPGLVSHRQAATD